jgi:hypothetical protein
MNSLAAYISVSQIKGKIMFQTLHRDEHYTIQLPFPLEKCLLLFTPEGERRRVPGLDPLILHPLVGTTKGGMVFITQHGAEKTGASSTMMSRQGGCAK